MANGFLKTVTTELEKGDIVFYILKEENKKCYVCQKMSILGWLWIDLFPYVFLKNAI